MAHGRIPLIPRPVIIEAAGNFTTAPSLNWPLEHPWITKVRYYYLCLRRCTVVQAGQAIPVKLRQLTSPHLFTRSLLQLHPSAKSARTRDATVPVVIPWLSICVNRIARLPSTGPGPHHPFGWLHLQTRPCSASMFPSGNF
jgi:hypothetical protein